MQEPQPKVSLSSPPSNGAQPGEDGYVPPSDLVPLPSLGKVYGPGHPLHLQTSVELRPMTTKEEDILTSRALLKSGKAISALIRSCLVSKFIDPDEMLVGDRNAVLVAIRSSGYGTEYRVDVTCPSCDETEKGHPFDLGTLPLQELKTDPLQPGVNAFGFTLPLCKRSVVFRLLTGADDRDLSNELERMRKAGTEQAVTMRLIRHIVSVDGNEETKDIAKLVRNLSPRDSRALRKCIEETTPDVNMRQAFVCPSCQAETEVSVPLGPAFFWPE